MTADDFLAALPPDLRAELRLAGGEGGLVLVARRDVLRLELVRVPFRFTVLELAPGRGAVNAEVLASLDVPDAYVRASVFGESSVGRLADELDLPLAVVEGA